MVSAGACNISDDLQGFYNVWNVPAIIRLAPAICETSKIPFGTQRIRNSSLVVFRARPSGLSLIGLSSFLCHLIGCILKQLLLFV